MCVCVCVSPCRWVLGNMKFMGVHVWFRVHVLIQFAGVAIATAGFAYAFVNLDDPGRNGSAVGETHKILGIIVYALTCVQVRLTAQHTITLFSFSVSSLDSNSNTNSNSPLSLQQLGWKAQRAEQEGALGFEEEPDLVCVCVCVCVCVQMLAGFLRPPLDSKFRPAFTHGHRWAGRITIFASWAVIYLGIYLYHTGVFQASLLQWVIPVAVSMGVMLLLDLGLTIAALAIGNLPGHEAHPAKDEGFADLGDVQMTQENGHGRSSKSGALPANPNPRDSRQYLP